MNAQQIFDKVATHLIQQGARAYSDTYGCSYRGDRGTSCAVGCLIRDAAYSPQIEGKGVGPSLLAYGRDGGPCGLRDFQGEREELLRKALVESDIPTDFDTLYLLERLQRIHDLEISDLWPALLRRLAEKRNLSTAALDAAIAAKGAAPVA